MKNAIKLIGTIAIIVAIAFTFLSCNNSDDGGSNTANTSVFDGLTKGNPSAAVLANFGLTSDVMDTMLTASSRAIDSDYVGYQLSEFSFGKELIFFWKNKSEKNFNNMTTDLAAKLSMFFTDGKNEFGLSAFANYNSGNYTFEIILATKTFSEGGVLIPKGSMYCGFTNF
jgi:hypothetical protein